jgi:hypothetical protein
MSLSIASMGTSVGELQRDYLHMLVIESLPAGFNGEGTETSKAIDCFLVKGVFPNRKTAEIAIKWAGETIYFSGVDESPKTGDLVFRLDENLKIKKLFERLKDLTGDLDSHAAATKATQTCVFKVYLIARNKQTITDARRLTNVIVYSSEDINPDKEGSGIQTFKVHISWDHSEILYDERGQSLGGTPRNSNTEKDSLGETSSDADGATNSEGTSTADVGGSPDNPNAP